MEASTRLVEDNPGDTSVGPGGISNILGVQEMDASIMCGNTLASGAVGAMKGFKHPISVARQVMEEAPHVLLVAEGAEHFARVMGCEAGESSPSRTASSASARSASASTHPSSSLTEGSQSGTSSPLPDGGMDG